MEAKEATRKDELLTTAFCGATAAASVRRCIWSEPRVVRLWRARSRLNQEFQDFMAYLWQHLSAPFNKTLTARYSSLWGNVLELYWLYRLATGAAYCTLSWQTTTGFFHHCCQPCLSCPFKSLQVQNWPRSNWTLITVYMAVAVYLTVWLLWKVWLYSAREQSYWHETRTGLQS